VTEWEYGVRATHPGKEPLVLPFPGEQGKARAEQWAAKIDSDHTEARAVVVRRPAGDWEEAP
jgi:hypothetical protein